MIEIVLVEDHNIVREGFKSILQKGKNVRSVKDFSNGNEALEYLEKLSKEEFPDIIITDVSMPNMSGIEFAHIVKTKYPNSKILVLSMHENEEYINKVIEVGGDGYLLKDSDAEELNKAINVILSGEKYFGYNVTNILINNIISSSKQHKVEQAYNLSEREKEVLKLIVDGLSNKLIASKLFVSSRTIDAHRYKIMQKLDAKNTAEMVRKAITEKLT
jgi:two-component system, NarL family, nitrate/nitrite response regulator NarL